VNNNAVMTFFASTELICIPCDLPPPNAVHSLAGSCQTLCIDKYVENERGVCMPMRVIIESPTVSDNQQNNSSDQQSSSSTATSYPVRTSRHSGMA
jgi:hypothetical protein